MNNFPAYPDEWRPKFIATPLFIPNPTDGRSSCNPRRIVRSSLVTIIRIVVAQVKKRIKSESYGDYLAGFRKDSRNLAATLSRDPVAEFVNLRRGIQRLNSPLPNMGMHYASPLWVGWLDTWRLSLWVSSQICQSNEQLSWKEIVLK